jgi:chromosome segregation ATPase
MKKILILLLFVPFFSCNNAELEKLKAKNDSLANIAEKRDAKINDFLQSFNEIQSNLDEIKQKEQLLTVESQGDKKLDQDAKEKINQDILAIYELMLKNKQKLAYLSNRLKASDIKIVELEKTISKLNSQLVQKDADLENLKGQLEKVNIDVANLNKKIEEMNTNVAKLSTDNETKEEVINQQDEALNTAYYAYGTSKELKEQKIIENDGLFKKKVGDNFSKDYFKKIDIRKTTTIELNCKKANILSTHPKDSYYLDSKSKGKVDAIVIKNPQKFWEVSKYLVIVID